MSRVCCNCLVWDEFFLTLRLKIETCVMTLLIPAWLKLNPSMIEIWVPYRFSNGSWLGIEVRLWIDVLWNGNNVRITWWWKLWVKWISWKQDLLHLREFGALWNTVANPKSFALCPCGDILEEETVIWQYLWEGGGAMWHMAKNNLLFPSLKHKEVKRVPPPPPPRPLLEIL